MIVEDRVAQLHHAVGSRQALEATVADEHLQAGRCQEPVPIDPTDQLGPRC